ncbi:MAG TPA: twin-arginine translocation signal domain-containing protein, partial [Candidatus Acidoferrum sp.]|nr:twin-arginine translocation signal domain-containing protein [Candidatus Acidoferrum sp.]
MLIKTKFGLGNADITPKEVYFNRRKFLQGLGIAGAAAVAGERLYSALAPRVAYAGTKLTTVKSGYTVN